MRYKQKISMITLSLALGLLVFSAIGSVSLHANAQSCSVDACFTVFPGEVLTGFSLQECAGAGNSGDISGYFFDGGTASSWASPQHIDWGPLAPGACSGFLPYTVTVPMNAVSGQTYQLTWSSTCNQCTPTTDYNFVVFDFTVTPQFPFGSIIAIIAPLSALGIYFGSKYSILGKKLSADELKSTGV